MFVRLPCLPHTDNCLFLIAGLFLVDTNHAYGGWSLSTCHCLGATPKRPCLLYSIKREGPFVHVILAFPPFSSMVCVVSLQAPGSGTCVCLAHRPSSREEPHTSLSGPLRMAEVHSTPFSSSFPHLPLLTFIWPPSRSWFAHAASLVFRRVEHVHNWYIPLHGHDYLFHSSCYLLMFWGCAMMNYFRLRHCNCAMMISYFTLTWFLLSALVLWWPCHCILPILISTWCSVCVGCYISCVCYGS
jgi:hypothetical protein